MRTMSVSLALQSAALAMVLSTGGHAADFGRREYSKYSLQSKVQYCTSCHGHSGGGYRGYFPMPQLAGQTSEYIENQLSAFIERRRENMSGLRLSKIHGLSPQLRSELATYFRELHARPAGGGSKRLVEAGKKIFEEGIPEANVPACSACHGPDAMGEGANPRLAGQLYPYVVKELVNWSKERGQNPSAEDASAIMTPIAQSLSKAQIEAVAAYISYQK